MTAIRSAANPAIKHLKKLLEDPRARKAEGHWVAEGVRGVEEALASGLKPTRAFLEEGREGERLEALGVTLAARGVETFLVGRGLLRETLDTQAPQGVALILSAPSHTLEETLAGKGPVLVLDNLREPGNLGTLLRTAAAFGCRGALLTEGTVDPGNPKALRASAGAALNLPFTFLKDPQAVREALKMNLYATSGSGGKTPEALNLSEPFALVLGQEAAGLGDRWEALVDGLVTLPMERGVESLNVAAAGAAILAEAARQRRSRP